MTRKRPGNDIYKVSNSPPFFFLSTNLSHRSSHPLSLPKPPSLHYTTPHLTSHQHHLIMVHIRTAGRAMRKQTALYAQTTWSGATGLMKRTASRISAATSNVLPGAELRAAVGPSARYIQFTFTTGSHDTSVADDAAEPGMNQMNESDTAPSAHLVTEAVCVDLENVPVSYSSHSSVGCWLIHASLHETRTRI